LQQQKLWDIINLRRQSNDLQFETE